MNIKIMRRSIVILFSSVVSLLIISCNGYQDAYKYVVIGAVHYFSDMDFVMSYPGVKTKVSGNMFEADDTVGVYVTKYTETNIPLPLLYAGNHANNIATIYSGALWEPEKRIYWPDSNVDVYGYYPYTEIISVEEQPFSIALDQSVPADESVMSTYEASDFLWAKAENANEDDLSGGSIVLSFKHRMSKLVIKLIKGEDFSGNFSDDMEVFIHNTVPNARINLSNGAVVKDSEGHPQTIKCRRVSEDTFEAIIVPQKISYRLPLLEIVSQGISFLVEDTFNFKPGFQHTINITINTSPEQIIIDIGGTVEGW